MSNTSDLTKTQAAALQFCRDYFARNDQLPSAKNTADHFSWASANAATEVFRVLEARGRLERNDNGKYRFKAGQRPVIAAVAPKGLWA